MPQNVTSADAYQQQIKIQESKSKSFSQIHTTVSEDEINYELSRVADLLTEERTPAVLRQMKSKLEHIPAPFSSLIGTWQDSDGLDILHHSIVNNCPDMVEFLLVEPNLFPPSKMPPKNPYAHLAAIFGFTECLRLILYYRPSDYFSGSKTNHVLKLPLHIKKKLKTLDTLRSNVNKHIEKLLLKLKSSTDIAEIAIQQMTSKFSQVVDVGNALTNEFDDLEKKNKHKETSGKKVKSLGLMSKFARDQKRGQVGATVISTPQPQTTSTASKFGTPDIHDKRMSTMMKTDKAEEIQASKYHKPQPLRQKKKHKISVFWDVFSESPRGVVKGAGDQINITYAEDARRERPGLGIIEMQQRPTGVQLTTSLKRPDKLKQRLSNQRIRNNKTSATMLSQVLEPGIRGRKKYKDFHLNLDNQSADGKGEFGNLRNKTPLSLAAQYGYVDCVQMILETFIMKKNPNMTVKEPLTLATKAKSPDAIMLLMDSKTSRNDYQSALLIAIREMYPDCLTALLARKGKDKQQLFDGINLYHVLYTQSLLSQDRYEMLPTMTNALINSHEDVNAHNILCTFPLYTLINCAFNITVGAKIFYYVECIKILLDNKANPHFDEEKSPKQLTIGQSFFRSPYSSAINCILESAASSVNFFESTYWSKIFMKKCMMTVTTNDRAHRRVLNDVLFNYMNSVCSLGLDRYIVRCLLRYGANADYCDDGKYAVNVYFDKMLPYLAKFEMNNDYHKWQSELNALMMVCRGMSYKCLKEAELIFLNEHLLQCPIQALPLCRYFSYLINEMLMSPRPLAELACQYIWLRMKRNEKRVKMLPLSDDLISMILP